MKEFPEKIFLTGFMGAGKTTVGRALARRLGARFCDLDNIIAEREGMGADEIISSLGEKRFREMESAALETVCSANGFAVVSTGGGTVVSEGNRRAMERAGVVVYLKAELETLMSRVSLDAPRPLLKVENPAGKAAELLAGREPFYGEAGFTVATDGLSPERVAEKTEEILRNAHARGAKGFNREKE